jgi:hypothetical protein
MWLKQIARNLTMSGVGFLDGIKYLILFGETSLQRAMISSSSIITTNDPIRAKTTSFSSRQPSRPIPIPQERDR